MGWWRDYEPSRPRAVRGGIKAHDVRGSNWWGKRWIETLDSYGLGARLGRGRTYARQGQVTSIDVAPGHVTAKVQGSRARPYNVSIQVARLTPSEWGHVRDAIRKQPLLGAMLLAGEMPQAIEEAFRKARVSVFPNTSRDLQTECSCPDWSNPCKHIAAVYILLGEEFDRDPFLIFRLRGMERGELLEGLAEAAPETASAAPPPEPLPADPALYWHGVPLAEGPAALYGEVRTPPVSAPLVRRLGRFPFWRGEESPVNALTPIYEAASARAIEAFLGGGSGDRGAEQAPPGG